MCPDKAALESNAGTCHFEASWFDWLSGVRIYPMDNSDTLSGTGGRSFFEQFQTEVNNPVTMVSAIGVTINTGYLAQDLSGDTTWSLAVQYAHLGNLYDVGTGRVLHDNCPSPHTRGQHHRYSFEDNDETEATDNTTGPVSTVARCRQPRPTSRFRAPRSRRRLATSRSRRRCRALTPL